MNTVVFTKSLAAASANNIATSQTPGAAALTLVSVPVVIDTATANNSAIGRRVIVTSGGNDTGINWVIVGTNASGAVVSDIFAGVSGGAAQSNIDFVTVISITPSGAVASTALAGTNGVGASPWLTWNFMVNPPMNLGFAVELVSGAVNYSVQYTYDDPNNLSAGVAFPLAFNSALVNQAGTADGTISTPFVATRVLINSGTGVIRIRAVQAGIG
jgi:hypothetical protein